MKKIAILAIALVAVFSVAAGTQVANANSATKKVVAVQKTETKKAASTEDKKPVTPAPVMVTVAEGDNLSLIAEAHQTTWVRLFNANESIVNPDVINPGDQLRVPTAEETLVERMLPTPIVSAAPVQHKNTAARTYSTATYPTDSNSAKAFIYSKESGNNPNATNPNGCYGIGQDCNGVLRSTCGADYACQDSYFTSYATRRYGSWEAAQSFWLANGWW